MPELEWIIIDHFYPQEGPLRETLIRHSMSVRDKALAIRDALEDVSFQQRISPEILRAGAMLHDIGICACHAPEIYCTGNHPYLAHGIAGGALLREYGRKNALDLEIYARICERHTGSGLTADEIRKGALPLPERDFLPESPEEKLICLADKFFSKSGNMQEKDLEKVRRSMAKFGPAVSERFEDLYRLFCSK